MKVTSLLLSIAILLLSASLPATAQKFLPKTIQFKGDPEYSNEELMAAAGLKAGTALSSEEIKAHSQKLMDTGVFDTVNFKFDGVDLVYSLAPNTALYPIRLGNLPLTPGKDLDAALHQRLPLYHGKTPFDGGLTEQVRAALEEMLAAKGIQATVAVAPFTDQKLVQVTAIVFSITSPAVRVGEIHLQGVSPEMQAKVKLVADRTAKAPYDTENAAGNIEHAFALFYRDEGYAAVKVHAAQSSNLAVGSENIEIPFNVTVEEGRHYKLGAIHLPSGELLTAAEIDKAAGAGSNATEKMSIRGGVTLRSALLLVTGQCKAKGHMECVVTPHPQYDDVNGIANYTFEVEPGPVYTMGKLILENGAERPARRDAGCLEAARRSALQREGHSRLLCLARR